MNDLSTLDRRAVRNSEELSPAELVRAQLDIAQRQLATSRERLIAARRRVAAMEEVVQNWFELSRSVG